MNQTQISVNHRQIGYRIKEVREQNHISQAQLAEMTDLSVSYISHIENAKRKASLESVIRIVNVLGITVDELLAGVQMNNPAAYQTDIDMLMEDCSENEKSYSLKRGDTKLKLRTHARRRMAVWNMVSI